MFVNSDAIYSVRPWVITNEGDIWFTKKKDSRRLYAIAESDKPWPRATWKECRSAFGPRHIKDRSQRTRPERPGS